LLDLLFDPEDGGDMLLRNVSPLLSDLTALYLMREKSSKDYYYSYPISIKTKCGMVRKARHRILLREL
jgi:hypothetical protein